jgi:putative FmdB family regulatory protein
MPIYEYRCDACGHQQEFLQRISDAPLKKCPACGKSKLKKLLSAAGFQLKGSGWYVTDFRDNKAKPAAKTGKADKPSDGAKSSDSASSDTTKAAPAATAKASGSTSDTKS